MLSEKQKQFVLRPFRHALDVAEGTPRSGKTTACILRFFCFLNTSADTNFLVVASTQQQAFRLVMDGDGNGLLHLFGGAAQIKHDDHGDHLEAVTATGTKKIYYKGGAKADSDKSIRGLSLGGVYFCEIDILHINMIQECFRRTYAAQTRWHLADLNPPAPHHPVIKDVFEVQDTYWTHWTVDDNPIITEQRKHELYQTLSKNPYLLRRDWYGERCMPQGVIYAMFDHNKHIVPSIPANERKLEMFFAGDGGLTDATSIGCYMVTVQERAGQDFFKLYRVAGWYYSGADTGTVKAMSLQARELAGSFFPDCRQKTGMQESCIKIDPACKALRAELDMLGLYTDKADNNGKDIKGNRKGIEVGIEYAQSSLADGRFFCVENNRFGHEDFLREIGMYCVDAHGHPVDMYNHAMDEFRYAHNYFYKNYVL